MSQPKKYPDDNDPQPIATAIAALRRDMQLHGLLILRELEVLHDVTATLLACVLSNATYKSEYTKN